jgi:thiol-disulfide isomerase/thioredoxin
MLAVLLAALLFAVAGTAATERQAAPDWRLRCADGHHVSFHDALADGPVLVSFWALWCLPCLKELPHLNRLAAETEGQLTVLAVNMDSSKSVAKVRPYLRSKGYDLIVPLDTAGDVGRLLHVGHILPFVALYDTSGCEVYRHVGYKQGDEIELSKQVQALLGGEPPAEETASTTGGEE